MIKSASQVELIGGQQRISFLTTTSPSSALIEWEGGSTVASVVYYDGFYSLIADVPADIFTVKLNTEDTVKQFSSSWSGSKELKEWVEIENSAIPYCDIASADFRFYTLEMEPLESWAGGSGGRPGNRPWDSPLDPKIIDAYGGLTLVQFVFFNTVMVRKKGHKNWEYLGSLAGYIAELVGHSRVTSDQIVNATICRDSLYDKNYRITSRR